MYFLYGIFAKSTAVTPTAIGLEDGWEYYSTSTLATELQYVLLQLNVLEWHFSMPVHFLLAPDLVDAG